MIALCLFLVLDFSSSGFTRTGIEMLICTHFASDFILYLSVPIFVLLINIRVRQRYGLISGACMMLIPTFVTLYVRYIELEIGFYIYTIISILMILIAILYSVLYGKRDTSTENKDTSIANTTIIKKLGSINVVLSLISLCLFLAGHFYADYTGLELLIENKVGSISSKPIMLLYSTMPIIVLFLTIIAIKHRYGIGIITCIMLIPASATLPSIPFVFNEIGIGFYGYFLITILMIGVAVLYNKKRNISIESKDANY